MATNTGWLMELADRLAGAYERPMQVRGTNPDLYTNRKPSKSKPSKKK